MIAVVKQKTSATKGKVVGIECITGKLQKKTKHKKKEINSPTSRLAWVNKEERIFFKGWWHGGKRRRNGKKRRLAV